jgi:phage terminase large subunit GpA-like protein
MRFNSFKDKMKVCFISTPEIKQTSLIEPAFQMGDQRYYFMPCPKCGAYIKFEWYVKIEGEEKQHAGVVFEKDEHNNLVEGSVGYICPECMNFFTERHKKDMLADGQWKPTGTPSRPDWLSYHISGLYSPPGFFDWTHHARQWLKIFPQGGIVKDTLSELMKLKYQKGYPQPAGFMNYPMPTDGKYTYLYFEQYEEEVRKPVMNGNGIEIAYVWEKRSQQAKNHFWDCRVYNLALRDIFIKIISKRFKMPLTWLDYCDYIK